MSSPPPEWTILYHMGNPPFAGRAQPIRMLFTDAGVVFTETNAGLYGPDGYCDMFRGSGDKMKIFDKESAQKQSAPFPVVAPPIIWHRPNDGDEVFINQLPAIMRYVGTSLGYAPSKLSDTAKCDKILLDVCDYISEGRSSFHPVDNSASYSIQKDEGDRVSKEWSQRRMLIWLYCFEKMLQKSSHEWFVVGDKVTYADIALYWACDATISQFENEKYGFPWTKAELPLLKAFKKAFDERPNIKNWTNKIPYAGDSMM
jgi:glutathione S-transferase